MPATEIFIEKPRSREKYSGRVNNRKKILEQQEIAKKRNVKLNNIEHNEQSSNPIFNRKASLFYPISIVSSKKIILLIAVFVLGLFSFLPFYINISTIFWEKNRKLSYDEDLLYRVESSFTIPDITSNSNDDHSEEVYYPNLPQLKVSNYRVKRGDSLYKIANLFNVSIDTIITANGIENGLFLESGRTLKVPNISGIFYTVKNGDSLYSISRKYGVSISSIADINDLPSSKILVGQRLFIPGGKLSDWDRAVALGEIFRSPCRGRFSSGFGLRKDPFTGKIAFHAGIDIANRLGTPIYAAQSGKVIYAGYYGGYGRTVIIQHPNGYKTLYAHLEKIYTRKGRYVKQGQKIALMGNTGRSTGPHLHFEIHKYRKIINPLKLTKLR